MDNSKGFQGKLFLNKDWPDYAIRIEHLYKAGVFTGICKIQVRRGPEGTKTVTKYAYYGAAYDTLDEVALAYSMNGPCERTNGSFPKRKLGAAIRMAGT